MKTILAVDQSTSATKVLLFDLNGNILDQTSIEHRQIYPSPGWVEHDVDEIYANLLAGVKILLVRNPQYSNDVLSLCITNQRETVVVFEKGSARPLHNAIVWQCRRGTQICDDLVQSGYNEIVHQKTGLKIDTYFSASKLKWLVDSNPQIRNQLESGQALIGTIDTYLIYRLTNGSAYRTDFTNASRTLLFDISNLQWDKYLCNLFHVPTQALPEVCESSSVFGETQLDGLLNYPIPICGVMGDSQASLFGLRCFDPGMAKVTFGTGSSLLLNIGRELKLSTKGIVSTIAWVYKGQPIYAFEGLINYSAATISWLKNQLKLIDDVNETEALALDVEDNGGVYLVPAFVGLSAPYWQPNSKAAIIGLTPFSNKNHIVRAALESIAYQVKDVLELMVQESGTPLKFINADGGAARNKFLMQFVADLVRYSIRIPEYTELSALGAVFNAYIGLNTINSLDELADLPQISHWYKSEMKNERADELYNGWKQAVNRVL